MTGKGGVGKTSVVAALAERFARAGKRVLVAETSPKEHISGLFGRAALPDESKARIDELITQLMSDPKGAYFESPAGKNYRHAVYYTASEGVPHL